ncbi:hypothetical protein ACFQ1I_03010 [Kitasatospora arboriphila]
MYPDASHGVGTFPYLSAPTQFVNPTSGRVDLLGGTRAGNAAAQAAAGPGCSPSWTRCRRDTRPRHRCG